MRWLMAKGILQGLIAGGLAAVMALPLAADIKIKTKREMMGHAMEDTVYIKGARERTEMGAMMGMNMNVITILQCDQNRSIQLNPATRMYMITLLDSGASLENPATSGATSSAQKGKNQPT